MIHPAPLRVESVRGKRLGALARSEHRPYAADPDEASRAFMRDRYDRRTFLHRLGVAALASPLLSVAGCRGDEAEPTDPEAVSKGGRRVVSRPILAPGAPDVVVVTSPMSGLPMAYVSRGLRQVFVDYSYRDRSNWILDAHISVSTGVWRIPLPGDPVGQPITPGDVVREFEELDIAEWDPLMEPAIGDFRIRAGEPASTRIDFRCVPMSRGGWYSAGPWDIRQCEPGGSDACREDFVVVGEGERHPIRGCSEEAGAVRVVTWACV
jgi:hypothetical protein